MAALDSVAVFTAMARFMGLDAQLPELTRRGWNTLAGLAFACAYVPGQGNDDDFVDKVLVPVLGDRDHIKSSALRRLYIEAYTMAAADLRSRIERTSDDPPRRLPTAERAARFEAMRAKVPGLTLEGELEPSYLLTDKAAQMVEEGVLKYVPWEECTTRADELSGVKKDRVWKPDSQGVIKEASLDRAVTTSIASDLRLKYALQRRGLSFEMGGLGSFAVHEKWANQMLAEYMREPPPGYRRVSINQLERADKEVFRKLAELTRGGLSPDGAGALALDVHMDAVTSSTAVALLLLPLPGSSSSATTSSSSKRAAPGSPPSQQHKKPKHNQGKPSNN